LIACSKAAGNFIGLLIQIFIWFSQTNGPT
jgi:hypothetical protein